MKNITVIGIDIAKNFLQLHGTDDRGTVHLKKRVTRASFLEYMAKQPKCLIGMEACGSAHYWAQELIKLGFTVKLMSPKKVKKFVDHNKNDANDAKACAQAALRVDVNAVSIKNEEQIQMQAAHRIRSFYVKHRTALVNMMRGLLLELGIAIPQGKSSFIKKMPQILAEENKFSAEMKRLLLQVMEDYKVTDEEIIKQTKHLEKLAQKHILSKQLLTIPGIGPLTATAMTAKIGNGSEFQKGRDLSAYLGIVPKQNSSGETQRLGRISKHGDRYLRVLLIHGGRSVVQAAFAKNKITKQFVKNDAHSLWVRQLTERIGKNKACVAVANKNARLTIALLKNNTMFEPKLAH